VNTYDGWRQSQCNGKEKVWRTHGENSPLYLHDNCVNHWIGDIIAATRDYLMKLLKRNGIQEQKKGLANTT
jgi:hypothetical protein